MHTLTNHDVFTITSTQANRQKSFTTQYAIGGSHTEGEVTFSTDLAFTRSTFRFENPILDVGRGVPEVHVSTDVDGTAQLDYGGPGFDITSEDGFFLVNFFDLWGHAKGESLDWRGDVAWERGEQGLIREIAAGARVAVRDASSIDSFDGGDGDPLAFTLASSIPGLSCVSEPMADGGPDYILRQWYTPCRDFLLDNTGVIRQAFNGTPARRALDPGSLFTDTETTAAIYVQAKLGGEIGAMPWSSLLGLRYVKTDEDLNGNFPEDIDPNAPGLQYEPIHRKTTEYDLLPSGTFRLNLTDELLARVSATRTVTRPNFADLNPGVSLGTFSNTTNFTGFGGNPNLRPVKSDNFDVSLEWYFAADGAVTATAFYRKLDGYVQSLVFAETYDNNVYQVRRPISTDEGNLQGIEVGYQQFYDFLPGFLGGLGLQINATYMEGDLQDAASGDTLSITGLSSFTYNIIGLYERGPVSARLAYNWRDSFLDVRNIAAGYDLYVDETAQLDGQISYSLNDNMTFTVEGINLLDTHFKDYFDDPNNPQLAGLFPRDTRRYDRTVLVGVRWRN
jgi:TonB-dependent receptor